MRENVQLAQRQSPAHHSLARNYRAASAAHIKLMNITTTHSSKAKGGEDGPEEVVVRR